jgi:hypothetical protein
MSEQQSHETPAQPAATPVPAPELRTLSPLIGIWSVSGSGLSGTVEYAWFENGAFLIQTVDLVHNGTVNRGIELIGVDPDSRQLRSHFFGNSGEILEYTYELEDDMLTIWFGEPGSAAKFTGRFDAEGRVNAGAWKWPGGGYESTMTRSGGDAA